MKSKYFCTVVIGISRFNTDSYRYMHVAKVMLYTVHYVVCSSMHYNRMRVWLVEKNRNFEFLVPPLRFFGWVINKIA